MRKSPLVAYLVSGTATMPSLSHSTCRAAGLTHYPLVELGIGAVATRLAEDRDASAGLSKPKIGFRRSRRRGPLVHRDAPVLIDVPQPVHDDTPYATALFSQYARRRSANEGSRVSERWEMTMVRDATVPGSAVAVAVAGAGDRRALV